MATELADERAPLRPAARQRRASRLRPASRLRRLVQRPETTADWAQAITTALVLFGCVFFVFLAMHPSKLFLNTTPDGGDMGAHVWAPWFLKNHLFPHGRISGWAPDWYNGFPALTFYFPGPYLAIALLSYVVPYGVAFKLVSVSGVLSLPLAAYAFGRLTRMRFPGPPLLAVATVPYLFDRYWTIWGGNIASTLAGEFSFSIGLSVALVFIGVFSYSLRTGRYRWLAALLLAAAVSCHILTGFFAIAGAVVAWLVQPGRRRLWRGLAIGAAGLAVMGWWLVPFAARLGYSNDMGWERSTAFLKGLFPFLCSTTKTDSSINCPGYAVTHVYTVHLEVVVALAAAGLLAGVILKRRSTLLLAGTGVVFAGAFRFMQQGTLWNARMLPFWYLCLYLVAATCLSESALAIGILFGRVPRGGGDGSGVGEDLSPVPVERERELVGAAAGHRTGAWGPDGNGWGQEAAPAEGAWGPEGPGWERGSTESESGGAGWAPPDTAAPGTVAAPGLAPDDGGAPDSDPGAGDWGAGDWGAGDWDAWHDLGAGDGQWPPPLEPDLEPELVPSRWPAIIAPLLVCAFVLTFVGQSIPEFSGFFNHILGHKFGIGGTAERASVNPNFVTSWADWNYSGYQEKSAYPEYRDVIDTMARVGKQYGCGRAMWEYEPEEDQFGTPMALMLLPMWTNECIGSQEGLFFESSATVPYHFLNQSELSANPSRAMRDLPYRNLDLVDGIKHLQLLGVRYYMAVSPTAQAAAQALTTGPHPMLQLIAQTGTHDRDYTVNGTTTAQPRHWQIYLVEDSASVRGLAYEPAVMQGITKAGLLQRVLHDVWPWYKLAPGGHSWISTVVPWYQDATRWPVELAASGPSNWPRVKGASANPPRVAVPAANVTNVTMSDDRISFDVDRTGSPVLVSTSYFPNWQAVGATGPWRVAPNLMVVVPTSHHVELHYGFTPVDNLGRIVTVAGLAGVAFLGFGGRPGTAPAQPAGDDGAPAAIVDEPVDAPVGDELDERAGEEAASPA